MPDEKRIIDLRGWVNDDCTITPYKQAKIIYRVKLLMNFPNDPDIREKFFTEFVAGDEAFERITADPQFLKLQNKGLRQSHNAINAGQILADIFRAQRDFPEKRVGVNKAVKLLAGYSRYHPRSETKMVNGEKVDFPLLPKRKISKRNALTYWKEYSPVAHLFAALLHHPTKEGYKKLVAKRRPNFEFFKPENFLAFMRLAKQLEDFATTHITERGQKPVIPPSKIWRIESDFDFLPVEIDHPEKPPRWVGHVW